MALNDSKYAFQSPGLSSVRRTASQLAVARSERRMTFPEIWNIVGFVHYDPADDGPAIVDDLDPRCFAGFHFHIGHSPRHRGIGAQRERALRSCGSRVEQTRQQSVPGHPSGIEIAFDRRILSRSLHPGWNALNNTWLVAICPLISKVPSMDPHG